MLPLLAALAVAATPASPRGAPASDARASAPLARPDAQAARLDDLEARLEQLRNDPRRRRYREGWESLLRELDATLRAAPHGARAAEVALTAGRVRTELFISSRAPADARAAFAALRSVDERFPGPAGLQALNLAVQLSWRTRGAGDRAVAEKRLVQRYPQSAEAHAILARRLGKSDALLALQPAHDTARPAVESAGPARTGMPAPSGSAPLELAANAAAGAKLDAAPAKSIAPVAARIEKRAEAAKPGAQPAIAPKAGGGEDEDDGEVEDAVDSAALTARIAARGADAAGAPARSGPRAEVDEPMRAASAEQTPAKPAVSERDDEAEEETPPEPEIAPAHETDLLNAVKKAVAAVTAPEPPSGQLSDAEGATDRAKELRGALREGDSIAAQLGLKVRRIVVDAGHGGKDTGAIGPHGVREKDLALSIAKKVSAKLGSLGFTVIMTRKDDTFVPLDERTRIANDAHADLFVSIHCNAAKQKKLQGVETWTLNVASDRYATRLAAVENADAERTVGELRLLIADLATRSNSSDAKELAQSVQSSMVRTLRSRKFPAQNHGVKSALFYVLLGTHMPSILVETGFVSNAAEEARLKNGRFQDGAADAISRGVKDFVDSRRKLASLQ